MNLRSVTVSAPGKVIIHGEHAVVFGKKAVAAAIGLQTAVELEPRHDEMVTLHLVNFETTWSWKTDELQTILEKLPDLQDSNTGKASDASCSTAENIQCLNKLADLGKTTGTDKKHIGDSLRVFLFLVGGIMKNWERLPSFSLKVNSSIPISAGLGSSAAYCVGLSAAFLASTWVISCPLAQSTNPGDETEGSIQLAASDLELICRWGLEGEKLLHGRPSGIDNSISTYGGILAFKDGNIEHLTRIRKLRILVIHTKVPGSTKAMVSGVSERYQEIPSVYNHMFEAVGAVAEESCVRLEKIDQSQAEEDVERHFSVLEKLIDINQQLLAILGVSHSSLDEVCHVTRKHGLHSKLTGAGGGGCAFTLLKPGTSDKSVSDVTSELRSLGYEVWDTYLGSHGVTLLAPS